MAEESDKGGEAATEAADFIREIGRYHGSYQDKSIPPVNGKYVFIWRKVGSDWKIWTDIWTSDTGQI